MRIATRLTSALAGLCLAPLIVSVGGAQPRGGAPPLVMERQIALTNVAGRIDHLAIDPARQRLFVAELGNGTVEALDLGSGRSLGRIARLREPQGLGYVPGRDELVVATGGDGMLRFYRAADLTPIGALKLGEDADNVRVLPQSGQVLVGYGKALAVVDPATRSVVRIIALPAHPEGFQVQGGRAFVNLPGAGLVAVIDLEHGRELARWRNPGPQLNFPLAFAPDARVAAIVYRLPARLVLRDPATGAVVQQLGTCGDADDAFFDTTRRRLYVICGAGAVDVFDQLRTGYAPAGRVPTRGGARTGLFAAETGRLYVAARAQGATPAAILVFRPSSR